MNKDQLSKLASLENDQTKVFLEEFALAEKAKIQTSKTNEEIIEHLELLNAIYYRVPKIIIWLINHLAYKAKPLEVDVKTTPIGIFKGNTHEDVIAKCFELARNIRYYEIEKAIKLSFDHINNPNKNVSGGAIKLIEEIVEYNFQAMPKIGIHAQLFAMDFLEKKITVKKIREENLPFVKIVLDHILETSSRTSLMTSPDTVTISSGDVVGHPNLAKIRRRAIDFALQILYSAESTKIKTTIFPVIERASSMPMNSSRDSDLGLIIQSDREYLVSELKSFIFKNGVIAQPLAIGMLAEHWLGWHFLHIELQQDIAYDFIKSLYSDTRYKLFSQFVHDDSFSYVKNKFEFVYDKNNLRENIISYVAKINGENKEEKLEELEEIASEARHVDEWKFFSFKKLLEFIGQNKPIIAFDFLSKIIKGKYVLSSSYFLPFLLAGLRHAQQFSLWDKSVDFIVKQEDQDMMIALIGSMYMTSAENPTVIRAKEDVNLLKSLIERKGRFSSYERANNLLRHYTINALGVAYRSNPVEVERLAIMEIKNNQDYFFGYIQNMAFSRGETGFSLENWSEKGKRFLVTQIIKLPDLDWHVQMLLPSISSPEEIVDLFMKRMKFRTKIMSKEEDYFESAYRQYDPVPYHMNRELVEYVQTSSSLAEQLSKYLGTKYSPYSYELSQLIKNLNVNPRDIYNVVLRDNKKTDTVLKKLVDAISSFDENDPDFLVELAGKTSSKSIQDRIFGKLSATGVVVGEFGISEAYKAKRESIEKYKNDENKNIRQFVLMAIDRFKQSEESHRNDAEREKEMRRIDFESNS